MRTAVVSGGGTGIGRDAAVHGSLGAGRWPSEPKTAGDRAVLAPLGPSPRNLGEATGDARRP
jgi:hypothetical protein